jgi:hypothetical protein
MELQSTQGDTGMQAMPIFSDTYRDDVVKLYAGLGSGSSELPELGGCYRLGCGELCLSPALYQQAQQHGHKTVYSEQHPHHSNS